MTPKHANYTPSPPIIAPAAAPSGSPETATAWSPSLRSNSGAWEICRLYVHPRPARCRSRQRLSCTPPNSHAIAAGATELVLWTDTRFRRAHRFYEKHSYLRDGPLRALHDIANSIEYRYAKPIHGIRRARHRRRPVRRAAPRRHPSRTAVDAGASVSFRAPLAPARARAQFWSGVTSQVGSRRLPALRRLVRRHVLAGTVQLVPATQSRSAATVPRSPSSSSTPPSAAAASPTPCSTPRNAKPPAPAAPCSCSTPRPATPPNASTAAAPGPRSAASTATPKTPTATTPPSSSASVSQPRQRVARFQESYPNCRVGGTHHLTVSPTPRDTALSQSTHSRIRPAYRNGAE